MKVAGAPKRKSFSSYRRVGLCVLLAILFLYNPFLAAGREHGTLTMSRPASYRATVASSEVEQFAPPAAGAAALLPALVLFALLIPILVANRFDTRQTPAPEAAASPRAGFSSSLWFRPPPTV